MPRWLRYWSVGTVVLCFVLLAIGGFVTSFHAGMADPVWPTEPWYLFGNTNWNFQFVIEHTHRLFGWLTGLAVTVLALAVWRYEPNRQLRLGGFVAIALLMGAYGEFHRGMGRVKKEVMDAAVHDYNLDPRAESFEGEMNNLKLVGKVKNWPVVSGAATAILAIAVIGVGVASGSALQAVALTSLVAVMIQGLLGGFRVLLNPLAGNDLAAIHGIFGQLTFCIIVATMVLLIPRKPNDALPVSDAETYARAAWVLVGLLVLQLIFAAMLRHAGGRFAQQMHILTAFAVTGCIIGLYATLKNQPEPFRLLGGPTRHLMALLVIQVLLGVEAYIGKFAVPWPESQKPPEERLTTKGQAFTRTAHQLVGCGLLASAVALALRAGRRPAAMSYQQALDDRTVPPVAAMAFTPPADIAMTGNAPDAAAASLSPPDGVIR